MGVAYLSSTSCHIKSSSQPFSKLNQTLPGCKALFHTKLENLNTRCHFISAIHSHYINGLMLFLMRPVVTVNVKVEKGKTDV